MAEGHDPLSSCGPHLLIFPCGHILPGTQDSDLQRPLAQDRDLIGSLASLSAFRNEPIPDVPDE